jgi:uncharacterized protein (TIGR02217 family)
MTFLETPTFPGCPSFGYTATPMYSVTVVRRASGHERRNANWSRPLYQYGVTVGPRAEADIQELLEFWHAVGGNAVGFRFKDWSDYKSCYVGDTPDPLDQPLVAVTGSPSGYQLTKRYTQGARSQDREIYKPVTGTIRVADNGTEKTITTDWTVDTTTGLVTLLFTPTGPLTWGGEFDVPVRFDGEFPVELTSHQVESVAFTLMELRQ